MKCTGSPGRRSQSLEILLAISVDFSDPNWAKSFLTLFLHIVAHLSTETAVGTETKPSTHVCLTDPQANQMPKVQM
jgi:hypothetical protein